MSLFSPSYFDNNFRRVLALKVYAMEHEEINEISKKQVTVVIRDGIRVGGNYPADQRETFLNTVNNNFGGLAKMRILPLWKTHIDIAMAIFNNRLQVTTENGVKNLRDDPEAVTSELIARFLGPEHLNYLKIWHIWQTEQSRKNNRCNVEDYKIACSFLCRIPTLSREDIKELCAFIVDWVTARYKFKFDKLNSIVKENVIETFKVNYNYEFVDLGPASTVLNDLQMSENALVELYKVWPKIDDNLPILNPHFISHRLVVPEIIAEEEKQPVPLKRTYRSLSHPQYNFSSDDDDDDEEEKEKDQTPAKKRVCSDHQNRRLKSSGKKEEEVMSQQQNGTLLPDPSSGHNHPSTLVTACTNSKENPLLRSADSNTLSPEIICPPIFPSDEDSENVENFDDNRITSSTKAATIQWKIDHFTRLSKQNDIREEKLKKREDKLKEREDKLKEKEKKFKEREEKLKEREKSLSKKEKKFQDKMQKQTLEQEVKQKNIMDREESMRSREMSLNQKDSNAVSPVDGSSLRFPNDLHTTQRNNEEHSKNAENSEDNRVAGSTNAALDSAVLKEKIEYFTNLIKQNDVRKEKLDEREKQLMDEMQKQKMELEVEKKRILDREESQTYREKSQNEREKLQNEREKSQNERDRLQNERR